MNASQWAEVRAVAAGGEIKVAQGEQTADQNQVRACF